MFRSNQNHSWRVSSIWYLSIFERFFRFRDCNNCRSIVWKTRSTFCMLKHFFFTSTYVLQLKRKYLLNSFSLSLSLTKERRGDGNNKTHNIKLAVTLFKYNITRFALSLSLSLSCIKHTHSLSLSFSHSLVITISPVEKKTNNEVYNDFGCQWQKMCNLTYNGISFSHILLSFLSLSLSLSLSNNLFYSFTLIYSPPSSLNISLSLDKLSML